MANGHTRTLHSQLLSSRGISILAALVADLALLWLLIVHKDFSPTSEQAESFWLPILIGFALYSILQIWTLATVTGSGDDFAAALDKFIALSPLVLVAVVEAYWFGASHGAALTWRHHLVVILVGLFAITDFFSTDITNQRLRSRQIGFGTPAG